MNADWIQLMPCFFAAALLYGSVGHGGASGYLAVMAFAGMAPAVMRPTALTLNLLVAGMGTIAYFRAGHFQGKYFWPFILTSVPMAWWGGRLHLPDTGFKILLGLALGCAAVRFFLPSPDESELRRPSFPWMLVAGALIGLASGLVGVGGGIFLTPLLLLCRWSGTRTAAAVSAPFIVVNSLAGLAGNPASLGHLPDWWPAAAGAVLFGGFLGARWGSGFAHIPHLRTALAFVLLVASTKLILS